MKAIYFDLDGTIADLYSYENWLGLLRAENTEPYEHCSCMVDFVELKKVLNKFIAAGITIGVISWGAKDGSREYCKRTRKAKKDWCDRYFSDVFTEFHVVKYGTPKHHVRKIKDSILVDDNADVRQAWKGETIDATEDIISILKNLLAQLEIERNEKYFNNTKRQREIAREQGLYSEKFDSNYKRYGGIYLIGQTSSDIDTNEKSYWVKVGLASDPHKRLASYLTHNADVHFLDYFPTKNKEINETICHARLSEVCVAFRTEWFKVSKKMYLELREQGFEHNIFKLE